MTSSAKNVTITRVDRLQDGIIVNFSDGTSTLFHNQFLYDVRMHEGNQKLPQEDEGDSRPTDTP